MPLVQAEIRPEPDDAERDAIARALGDDPDAGSPYASAWRRTALEESRGGDDDGRTG